MDRFPALSGLAKELVGIFPGIGDYVAGLWMKDLAQQLLWKIGPNGKWNCWLNKFIGPSWSWVSIESAFMLPTTAISPCDVRLEILDYSHSLRRWQRPIWTSLSSLPQSERPSESCTVEYFNPGN